MGYYFRLQFKRFWRRIEELGLHPILVIILLPLLFVGLSKYLFIKTDLAGWVYFGLSIVMLLSLNNTDRIHLLKSTFTNRDFIKIRLLENVFMACPFLLYMLYEGMILFAIATLLIAFVMALYYNKTSSTFVLVTPFKRQPFEFIVGFRKSIVFLFLVGFVLFQAIRVDNFNLGLFALGMIYFIGMSYYGKPENKVYTWIFTLNCRQFLFKKITQGLLGISVLAFPVIMFLVFNFKENWWIIIGVAILGNILICTIILAKYSAYPKEMSLPQGIMFAFCVWFPPMLIVAIPIFYKQSIGNLKPILE